jgi:hypothetical protein
VCQISDVPKDVGTVTGLHFIFCGNFVSVGVGLDISADTIRMIFSLVVFIVVVSVNYSITDLIALH